MSTFAAVLFLALIAVAIVAGYYAIGRFVTDAQFNVAERGTGFRGFLATVHRGFDAAGIARG